MVPIFEGENMALSAKARKRLEVAMARRQEALEVIAAIDSSGSGPAASVAAITSTDLVGVTGAGSNAAPLAGTETRLDAIEAKINAVISALKAAGLMLP